MTLPFFHRAPATRFLHRAPSARVKPVIGVLCCNEFLDRPVQVVASRFIDPLSHIAQATVLLVPAMSDMLDAGALADRLDGLLLTGSRSNMAAERYGGSPGAAGPFDTARDAVALALAERMIEAGRPVFGICRGLQELNVLFGGTLSAELGAGTHHRLEADLPFEALFDHEHDVLLAEKGLLAATTGVRRITVNSVHSQGIDRLGSGLTVEAIADQDDLVEAFSARPCGGQVLAVQWHPEWNGAARVADRHFFQLVGTALREQSPDLLRPVPRPAMPIRGH